MPLAVPVAGRRSDRQNGSRSSRNMWSKCPTIISPAVASVTGLRSSGGDRTKSLLNARSNRLGKEPIAPSYPGSGLVDVCLGKEVAHRYSGMSGRYRWHNALASSLRSGLLTLSPDMFGLRALRRSAPWRSSSGRSRLVLALIGDENAISAPAFLRNGAALCSTVAVSSKLCPLRNALQKRQGVFVRRLSRFHPYRTGAHNPQGQASRDRRVVEVARSGTTGMIECRAYILGPDGHS